MNHTTRFAILTAVLLAGAAVYAADENSDKEKHTVTLRDGKVLEDAYILDKKPNGITLAYKDGCKFIKFSRTNSEDELIARRTAKEIDGENADFREYIDPEGEKYKMMVDRIRRRLGLTSLAFQHLDDMIRAIGLPKDRICTYCWTGEDVSCPNCCHCSHKQ